MPGESEVVGIATEEGGLLLRREHEAHVRIFLIAVNPIFAALIESYDIGTQAGFLLTLALDLSNHTAARGEFLPPAFAQACFSSSLS